MNEIPETSNISNGVTDLETLDYLRGVKSSTCLLLPTTPSPTPLDFKHPLSEDTSDGNFISMSNESNLQTLDSSSSGDSNSVVQDPVSAQLINNISMLDYQTLSKNGDLIMGQAEDCKLKGHLSAGNRKLPNFVNWNWSLIRKVLLWIVLSALVACVAAIIAMVVTIPKECNPDLPWYQGKVFYEVFPASFEDSNNDETGDFKGLIRKLGYIQDFGASAIRLNYIFKADNYPENYYNTTSILEIHSSLGNLKDFQQLVAAVHSRNMYLILDIPVTSLVTQVTRADYNSTDTVLLANDTLIDPTSTALAFWAHDQNVDGFYLKNLERYVENVNFAKSLQIWKRLLGNEKIFIASYEAYEKAKGDSLNVLLSRVDLIDVYLNLDKGITGLKNHINEVINGDFWSKPYYPWIHWNIGSINSERISEKHADNILSLIALELVLPGTISIFYGDEIGLGSLPVNSLEQDFEHQHIHNLVPMSFPKKKNENAPNILPWNSKSTLEPKFDFSQIIQSFIQIRVNTPTIYLRAIYKEGNNLKNTDIRNTDENLVVIERWYPRRNTCVFVGNFGKYFITTDLSSMFYGGIVVASTNNSLVGQVLYFDQITFSPHSALILKLEK